MKARFDFSDAVVVVTGGAGGIGAALARACADAGATVVVADVEPAEGLESIRVDVSDRGAVGEAMAGVIERHGRVDGLVCSAVVQPLAPVLDVSPEQWRRAQAVNVEGVLWCAQAVLPGMLERDAGSIVVFSSGVSEFGKPEMAAYGASKGAVVGLARTLARETAGTGVRVNVFRPGVVDTKHWREGNPGADPSGLDAPEDAVGPLMFLLSEQASMTGSTVTREMPFKRRRTS